MSSIEEDSCSIAPWVGPKSCKNVINVAVLCANVEIVTKISEALVEIHSKGSFRWKIFILRLFSFEQIIEQSQLTGKMAIDFVILAVDTSKMFCLEWTKVILKQIHPDLRKRRVVFVNANGLPTNAMVVDPSAIIALTGEESSDILNANVFNRKDVLCLAQRLIKYMEVSVGVQTGIPCLHL